MRKNGEMEGGLRELDKLLRNPGQTEIQGEIQGEIQERFKRDSRRDSTRIVS
jgi:hypothetical protein